MRASLSSLLLLLPLAFGSLAAQDTTAAPKGTDPEALSAPATYRVRFMQREVCRTSTWLHLINRTGYKVRVSIGRRALSTAPAGDRDWPMRVPEELLEDLLARGVTVQGVGGPTPPQGMLIFSLSCNR